ncbi:MAG: multicopper oxidase domain-containing protein [Acidobacteriota bacterium]
MMKPPIRALLLLLAVALAVPVAAERDSRGNPAACETKFAQLFNLDAGGTPTRPLAVPQTDVVAGCEFVAPDPGAWGREAFRNPPEVKSADGKLAYNLVAQYGEHEIAGCPVKLRGYNGQIIGPTIRVKPGDSIDLNLVNSLPLTPTDTVLDPASATHTEEMNTPTHGANTTNLHTHGWHISPNQDDVLTTILPGQEKLYHYDLESNHDPGTFWYHPHSHGSTAMQVSSGMVGALIVEGGLDEHPEIAKMKDQVMVFSQVAYDHKGEIEDYCWMSEAAAWSWMQRPTLVNGQVLPTLTMTSGEVQRWRLMSMGQRESIYFSVIDPANLEDDGTPVVNGNTTPVYEISTDGLATGRLTPWNTVELHAAYRADVLFQAPTVADGAVKELWVVDAASDPTDNMHTQQEYTNVLFKVRVVPGTSDTQMPSAESLASYAASWFSLGTLDDSDVTGDVHEVMFRVGMAKCDPKMGNCTDFSCVPGTDGCALSFTYSHRRTDVAGQSNTKFTETGKFNGSTKIKLQLGKVDKWRLWTGRQNSHPFHIHINPFQVKRTLEDGSIDYVWKDTVMIKASQHTMNTPAAAPGTPEDFFYNPANPANDPLEIYTKYVEYTGEFVQHCHILDHEDQGMMQLLAVCQDINAEDEATSCNFNRTSAHSSHDSGSLEMSEENAKAEKLTILQNYVKALVDGSFDAVPMTDDVTFLNPYMTEPIRGKDTVQAYEEKNFSSAISGVQDGVVYLVDGDHGAAFMVLEFTKGWVVPTADYFRFEGGKIAEIQPYFDTAIFATDPSQ